MTTVAASRHRSILAIAAVATAALAGPVAEAGEFQPFVSAGLTVGGDRMATTVFTNGDRENIDAGELFQLGGGVLWNVPDSLVGVSLSLNYHTDFSTAENGDVEFTRYPIELLAHHRFAPDWRIGGGLRYVMSPKFDGSIDFVASETVKFDNAIGLVVELGYAITPDFHVNARYVNEEYDVKSHTFNGVNQSVAGVPAVDGSHFGVNVSYAF